MLGILKEDVGAKLVLVRLSFFMLEVTSTETWSRQQELRIGKLRIEPSFLYEWARKKNGQQWKIHGYLS